MKKLLPIVLLTVLITALVTSGIFMLNFMPTESTVDENEVDVVNELNEEPEVEEEVEQEEKDEVVEDKTTEKGMITVDEDDYNYLLGLEEKYRKLEMLEEYIRENYYLDVDDIDFQSEVLKGLFEALDDPYSQYFTEEEFEAYTQSAAGEYEGIGVVVAPGDDGFITVVSPIHDSPGFEAGLMTNDKILKVDGVEFTADQLQEAVMNIRGPAETTVVLTIKREDEIIDIPVVRRKIKLEAVASEMLDDNIGYIQMFSFDQDVALEFKKHLELLERDGMEALLLDLRNNGGGYLSQCLRITDSLIGEGIIVKTKDNKGNVEIEYSDSNKLGLPIVVLVNEGSASASEILTGAIKDNDEGTIVGTQTFGKGLVQTMLQLTSFDESGFKLTIQQYFTPDDHYIHDVGIEPDVVIEDDPETEEDEQYLKALELIYEAIK
jgi:carboxyl-terminal processing protease